MLLPFEDLPRRAGQALSAEICPACRDHALHVNPVFDAHDEDGRRICAACANLADLRRFLATSR